MSDLIFTNTHNEMLNRMAQSLNLLENKGEDYGKNNFKDAAAIAAIITGRTVLATDVAACLIGIKCARIGTLLNKPGEPRCEAIEDSFCDLSNYVHLMLRERARLTLEKVEIK